MDFKNDIFNYLKFSFINRGILNSLRLWVSEIRNYSIRKGTRVIDKRDFPKSAERLYNSLGYNSYQATYFSVLVETLPFVRKTYGSNSLIDLGSGNGRVLEIAHETGFSRLLGVEIDKQLYSDSVRNLGEIGLQENCLLNADATLFTPTDYFEVLFIFNPFKQEYFDQYLSRCMASNVMPKIIISVNPSPYNWILQDVGACVKSKATGHHIEYGIYEVYENYVQPSTRLTVE